MKFKNLEEESNFYEDLNEIKNYILVLKEVCEACANDLNNLFDKVDELLKYL